MARQPIAPPVTTRFTVMPARSGLIDGYPAFSPDGRRIAYTLLESGGSGALWVHDLDSGEARPLAGTEVAQDPFWSPDGRFVAFFTQGQLRRIPAEGGTAQTICAAPDSRGGTWGAHGDILFTQNSASGIFHAPPAAGRRAASSSTPMPRRASASPGSCPAESTFCSPPSAVPKRTASTGRASTRRRCGGSRPTSRWLLSIAVAISCSCVRAP